MEQNKKNYYTGDLDAYHEGPCCSGCIGERELGYSGGGMHCCCYEGLTPLEQWGNPVEYPPVNGWFPIEFKYFGDRTRERYYQRFKDQLTTGYMDTYTLTSGKLRTVTKRFTHESYAWEIE